LYNRKGNNKARGSLNDQLLGVEKGKTIHPKSFYPGGTPTKRQKTRTISAALGGAKGSFGKIIIEIVIDDGYVAGGMMDALLADDKLFPSYLHPA